MPWCAPAISISCSASPAGYGSRAHFLTDLTLDPPSATSDEAGPPRLDEDYLILSTIHSAKGQEWKCVFVLNVVDGCIPSDMATGSAEEIEEERRLLYVAMTRAKDQLMLLLPQRFYVHQQARRGDKHLYASRTRFIPARARQPLRDAVMAGWRSWFAGWRAAHDGHHRHRRPHAPDVARHRDLKRPPCLRGDVTWVPALRGDDAKWRRTPCHKRHPPRRRGPSARSRGESLPSMRCASSRVWLSPRHNLRSASDLRSRGWPNFEDGA